MVLLSVKWDVLIIYSYVTSYHKSSGVDQALFSSKLLQVVGRIHFLEVVRLKPSDLKTASPHRQYTDGCSKARRESPSYLQSLLSGKAWPSFKGLT